MLKAFRRYRQKLIRENRTTQYLLYAIGEIMLVVIGILIAVQINNWNEERRLKNVELQTLIEIRSSLATNLAEVQTMSKVHEAQIAQFNVLIDHVEQNLVYHDSLESAMAQIFGWYTPLFDYAPYETLKARGIELISNDTIKKNIVAVYEKVIFRITNGLERFESGNSTAVVLPYFAKNFELDQAIPPKVKANDYEALRKDKEYKNVLKLLVGVRTFGIQLCKGSGQGIEAVITQLDKEIAKLGD